MILKPIREKSFYIFTETKRENNLNIFLEKYKLQSR